MNDSLPDPDLTKDVYAQRAFEFDAERTKTLFEKPWLDRFTSFLPPGSRVLDLGCGAGDPIAKHLIAQGFRITGVDFSNPLLALAKDRFPDARWIEDDLRHFEMGETFDGIIAWHSLFHLTQDEQRDCLPRIAQHLSKGGCLLMTAAPVEAEFFGHAGGHRVYHSSLSETEYRQILSGSGIDTLEFVKSDPQCGGATVLLGVKR